MATLFNLVSDIVGGIRVTVLEEEVVERTASSARRYVVRRPPLAATGTTAWNVDDPVPSEVPAGGRHELVGRRRPTGRQGLVVAQAVEGFEGSGANLASLLGL